jgi:serine/threonine-protein kinase
MTKERAIRFRHYDIIKALGDGPFGAVYLAHDIKWERHIALKLLHSHLVPNTIAMKRFINEGRTMQELRHLDIVEISHVEEDSPQPYIEMEFVNGLSLERYLQSGMLPIQRVLRFLRQIADILDRLHEQGVIHRNLKASNVLIDPEGRFKLADFGLNLLIEGREHRGMTKMLLGNPRYLAPEQTQMNRHHEIGSATDVYALGVIAFQMLTGSVPFDGRINAILSAHRTLPPPNPRHLGIKLSNPGGTY